MLHTGWQFHRFVLWATDGSDFLVPRPASLENIVLGAWLLALQAGLWDQRVPLAMLQRFYRMFLE